MTTSPPDPPQTPASRFDSARIDAQLHRWQERLLDLTKGNPLLGINRSRVSKLLVTEPDAATLFDRIVTQEEKLRMPLVRRKGRTRGASGIATEEPDEDEYVVEPGDISVDAKPADLQRRLRRIFDNARTTVEERGVTTLHLAFGVLNWEEPALGHSVSPLWLVPCQFENSGPNTALRLLLSDEEMQLNPALELYLRERHHITLPPIPEDATPVDLSGFFNKVRAAVQEQGWSVSEEVWLSTFSFESLVIYQDLRVMAEVARTNPVIAALARAGSPAEGSEALGEDLDDLPSAERVPVPILPADASQLRALTLAASSRNIVVHGPPGTGKSQTISNLIADALGRRQTVLFVSAKMAALDVVHDRIAERGLGRFCLEAHSTKAGKAKIIEELKRTLETRGDGDGRLLGEQLDEFREVRSQLNDYVIQLHQRREPLGLTIFQAIGKVAKLHAAPTLEAPALPWENPLSVARGDLRAALDLLAELAAQAAVFDRRSSHPWRGLAAESDGDVRQEDLEQSLSKVEKLADGVLESLGTLSSVLGPGAIDLPIEKLRALAPALNELGERDRLPDGWRQRPLQELESATKLLRTACEKAKRFREARTEYEYSIAIPFAECQLLLTPVRTEFKLWTRVLRTKYWRWRASVRSTLVPGASSSFLAMSSLLSLADDLATMEAWFRAEDPTLANLVDSARTRDASFLLKTAAEYQTAALLRATLGAVDGPGFGDQDISPEIRTAAKSILANIGQLETVKALEHLDSAWPSGCVDGAAATSTSLGSLRARCQEALAARPRFHEWALLCHTLRRCRQVGLDKFISALGDVSSRFAPAAFERRFYTLWTQRAIEQSPAIKLFSPERRAERTERFRQLDIRIRESALGHIKATASEPAASIAGARTNLGEFGEVGILRRELQKGRRIKPLRKLFAEIPRALQALKPCMLMSPLSVSTFLKPGALTFDLVVFDEASQLPTPEAVPSILRAKQVVVAGDEKQLPPTSFFDASTILDEEGAESEADEALEPLESLLDDCVAINPVFLPTYLAWHYRSRDERLISFSNHYFYNNGLVTFPSASTGDGDRGVHHVFVADGIWDRGRSRTNRREAQRVAELIVEQLDRHPDRTLGVVAMNTTQREAIEVALNELVEQRPDVAPLLSRARHEPFFIKSLENVQGDERDSMIVSVGYAKTAGGALSLNFGPLNREGGWRRLNVLVTRAKWQTILVTSMRSQDLVAVSPNNRGAFMLRKFIEYAEQGGVLPRDPATLSKAETNDFEEAVAEALRQADLEVDEQVGVGSYRIDLAVRDPRDRSRYLLGVECDGATFHSAKTARDRDLLRQQVLRNQGWRLYRLWSTDWFHDRDHALQGVLRAVEQAMQAPAESVAAPLDASSPPAPRPAGAPMDREPTPASPRQAPGAPYRRYQPSRQYRSDGITNHNQVPELAAQIAAVVRFEGPIHEELLMDRLKEIYGFSRAGSNIQDNVRRATSVAVRQHGLRHDEPRQMLYPGNQPIKVFRVSGDGVERTIAQIAPEEIALAVLFVVEDQFGFQRDRLPRAVADLLKVGRTTVGVAETVGGVVDDMIERGQLRLSGPNVYLP